MMGRVRSRRSASRSVNEYGVRSVLIMASAFSIFVLGATFVFLLSNALPFFGQVPLDSFLLGTRWDPTNEYPLYGVLPLFVSTLLVSMVSAVIAIPIGLGCTIYLAEIAHPKVKAVLKPAIEVLAGIPSVVYGFFALVILSQWINDIFHPTTILNLFNGGVMLAVMMIPIMVSLSEDAINAVPRSLREASLALGMTRWETIRKVILPAAMPGIVAAIVLSIGRAVGETMTVLMATGNATALTFNIFQSGQTMTATIAIEVGEVAAGTTHYHALFAIGLLLFLLTFAINIIADWLMHRYAEAYK